MDKELQEMVRLLGLINNRLYNIENLLKERVTDTGMNAYDLLIKKLEKEGKITIDKKKLTESY